MSQELTLEQVIASILDVEDNGKPLYLDWEFTKKIKKAFYQEVIKKTGGNKSEAARILGINRATLSDRILQYGLTSYLSGIKAKESK